MGKKKILIVDDERGFTEMVKLNLEITGNYEVIIENKAVNALDTACRFKPDLILMDIIMPDKEGPDVVKQIRDNRAICNTPVVFLTATITSEEVDENSGRIGGYAFLAKPSTLSQLVECIERQFTETSE